VIGGVIPEYYYRLGKVSLTVSSAFRNAENVILLLEIGSQENEDDNFRNLKLVPPQQVVVRLIAPCEKWQEARLGRLWPTELYTGYFDTVNVTLSLLLLCLPMDYKVIAVDCCT